MSVFFTSNRTLGTLGISLFLQPAIVLLLLLIPQSSISQAIEEVIVTARQQAESMMDVPASVTAFSSQEIENASLDRPKDFIMMTPGLSQVQTLEVGDMQVNIRGINSGRDTESSVALVIDGILATNPNALNQEMDNMQQIEVLKGPQGAIYGRNALAGAIVLTTKPPTDDFEGVVEMGVGNNNRVKGALGLSGPISEKVKASFRYHFMEEDGYATNSLKNCDDCETFFDDFGVVARAIINPTDDSEIDIKARYSEVDGGSLAFNASLAFKDAADIGFGPLWWADPNEHKFVYINRNDPTNKQESTSLSVKGVFNIEAGELTAYAAYNDAENFFLGAGTSNAFGIYNANDLCLAEYNSAASNGDRPVPLPFFYVPENIGASFLPPYPPISCGGYQYQQRDQEDLTLEVRLSSARDESFRWMVGANYLDVDRHLVVAYSGDLGLGATPQGFNPTAGPNPTDLLYDDNLLSEVMAVFGNIEYDITETVELSVALRYDEEKRTVNNNVPKLNPQTPGFGAFGIPVCSTDPCDYYINPYYNANPTAGSIPSRKETFDQLQPKISISYQPSDRVTYFASYGIGFRSGGFNSQGTTATLEQFFGNLTTADGTKNLNDLSDSFDKEISKAFELGFKSRLLENTLVLNGAIYFTDTEDMQDFSFFAGPFGSLRVVTNIDEAEIRGAEIDFKWRASNNLTVYGGIGVTDTEIKKYSTRPYTAGNKLPYIPEATGNFGVEYVSMVGSEWEFLTRVDLMYAGETWWSPVQDNYLPNFFTGFGFGGSEWSKMKRDSYVIGNLNFVITNDIWRINLWSKNITGEDYLEEVIPAPEFGGSFIHDSYGRSFGVNVSRTF